MQTTYFDTNHQLEAKCMTKNFLIIGTSAAGIGCAVKLRTMDPSINITCITAEAEMPYNRCLLADFIAGEKSVTQVGTKTQDFFDQNRITLMRNSRVVSIDAAQQKVELASGQRLGYDHLFIGTGRTSRRCTIPGSSARGVFSLYDLKDSINIFEYTKNNSIKHATIIGAGLTGLECADALTKHKIAVDIIEMSPQALPSQLNKAGSDFLTNHIQKNYTATVHLEQTAVQILERNGVTCGVELSTGSTILTDMVIFAVGGQLSTPLAREAGITCSDTGILVNDFMQTNIKNIFAGGDVCMIKDLASGNLVQSCLWPDATMQGMTAAFGMLGKPKLYPGTLIVTASHIFGIHFVTCGSINEKDNSISHNEIVHETFYHNYTTKDRRLTSFIMIGNVNNVGQLRKLIIDQREFQPLEIL